MDLKEATQVINLAPSIRNYSGKPHIITLSNYIYSYNTCVAVLSEGTVYVPKYYSPTTTRHINKIAEEWFADVVKLY